MKINKGISLIVLVITIIVIIILAGSVILSLSTNNPIDKSKEATFKTNVGEYNSELALTVSGKYILSPSFDPSTFDKGVWDGNGNGAGTIKEYITSITVADAKKFEIRDSKLLYVGSDETEKNWLAQIGIENGTATPSGLGTNVITTANVTVNGQAASYSNPIVPKGFKAINDGAAWPTDWDKGLVIEDASGNQFVWVPVDGTNVPYAKWCTSGIEYNDSNISDDTLPSGFSVVNLTTTYKGFYIARYEAMFDYNGGSIRAASKKSLNKTQSDWSATRNATYTGYLWNFISYNNAKTYAENMDTSYGYDISKVGTNLITGAQWDTTMKWIQNSSPTINVATDSRTWGNYSDSMAPANVGNGSLQISGFSDFWKSKNIYDLAGNAAEVTNEVILNTNYSLFRGGSYDYNGSTSPASNRNFNPFEYNVVYKQSFRTALYIL